MSAEVVPTPSSSASAVHGLHVQIYARGPSAPVRWRLLSGNHRDMGRGALDFQDEESCQIGIKETVEAVDRLAPTIVRVAGNRWSWRLSLAGTVVATSGHSFDRRGRCEEACTRFLQLMPGAEVRSGVAFLVSGGSSSDSSGIPRARLGVSERWSAVHRTSPDPSSASGLLEGAETATLPVRGGEGIV
jgi:hypothetical protein